MQDHFHALVMQILDTARKQGYNQKQLAELADLDEVALSRLKKAGDARFSTLDTLGRSVGKKLVWIDDKADTGIDGPDVAELVTSGTLFKLR